jgi:hypothetical protein
MTATNCERRRYEQGSVTNSNRTSFAREKKSNMLIETNWLNMLVDRGENKGWVIQADQV